MKPNNKCPKCGGEFEVGIIPDYKYAGVINSRWATKIKHFGLLENKKI